MNDNVIQSIGSSGEVDEFPVFRGHVFTTVWKVSFVMVSRNAWHNSFFVHIFLILFPKLMPTES